MEIHSAEYKKLPTMNLARTVDFYLLYMRARINVKKIQILKLKLINNMKTITSLELANAIGKSHAYVLIRLRWLEDEWKDTLPSPLIKGMYEAKNGEQPLIAMTVETAIFYGLVSSRETYLKTYSAFGDRLKKSFWDKLKDLFRG